MEGVVMDPSKDPRLKELIATTRREVENYQDRLSFIFSKLRTFEEASDYEDIHCTAWNLDSLAADLASVYEGRLMFAYGPLINYIIEMREREIFGTTALEIDEQRRKERGAA